MEVDHFLHAKAKSSDTCYTLHARHGESHELEEHEEEWIIAAKAAERDLMRQQQHAELEDQRVSEAAKAASESMNQVSSRYTHTYMMGWNTNYLDRKIGDTWNADDQRKYTTNVNQIVHDCLVSWFQPDTGRVSGYTPPSDEDIESVGKHIQAKVYQAIQHEIDNSKETLRAKWPKPRAPTFREIIVVEEGENVTPEMFDISSTNGDNE